MEHDPTTTMLLKLPLSLKEALTTHSLTVNLTVSHLIRLAITRSLNLPDHAANMSGPRPHIPTPTSNTDRRRKARRIQRQLATLAPEVIAYLLEQEKDQPQ